jgi:hypothetical protein
MKMSVFKDVSPYGLVEVADVSEALAAFIIRDTYRPDDGGSKYF